MTAGNSSGVNDGAAAMLVASEPAVERYGLTPLARVTSMVAVGVPPRVMGIGPAPGTRKLLARTGWTIADVDVLEVNEAFAARCRDHVHRCRAGHRGPAGGAVSPTDDGNAPQSGENTCPDCAGTGRRDGDVCPTCTSSPACGQDVGMDGA